MNMVLQKLQVRHVAPVIRKFDQFWTWWTGELTALLPEPLRTRILQRNQCVRIDIDADDLAVCTNNGTDSSVVGRIDLREGTGRDFELPVGVTETQVVLPAEKVLIKQMTLPLATEENLREALSFQMDRQTPFNVEQVYYDSLVKARDSNKKTLTIDLVVTPRKYVDTVLDTLADNGLSPDRIAVSDKSSSGLLAVNLLPVGRLRKNGFGLGKRRNLLLAIAVLTLASAALATPIIQKRQIANMLEPQLQQAVEEARRGTELRQQVEQLTATSEYLRNKKQSSLLVLRAFDEVTRLLPDSTWVSQLDIDTREIQLYGQSSTSAALIQRLEGSPLLRNVRFRSPLTRIGNTEEDRFHLSADLIQELSHE